MIRIMPSFLMCFIFQSYSIRGGGHNKSWQKLRLGSGSPEEMRRPWLWQAAVVCRTARRAVLPDR